MTYRDPSLPHQIILMYDKQMRNAVRVTCNCLATQSRFGGNPTYEFMPGVPKDTAGSWVIYRNPENHRVNQGVAYTVVDNLSTDEGRTWGDNFS